MMNGLSLLASLVDSLAWPVTVIIIALSFKRQVGDLFESLVNLKWKDLEISFSRGLVKAKEELKSLPDVRGPVELPDALRPAPLPTSEKELIERIADISPSAAVLESWRSVEGAVKFYCAQHGLKQPVSGQGLLRHLSENPQFPPQLLSAYQELRLLRNKAAHDQNREISRSEALEFAELAEKLALELSVAAFM